MATTFKQRLGCWWFERLSTEHALFIGKGKWRSLCNRHEVVEQGPTINATAGYRCDWEHSSELTVSRIFPAVGSRLLAHCFPQIEFRSHHARPNSRPAISVLIPIGGLQRAPLLKVCLSSLAAAAEKVPEGVELIVAEQVTEGSPSIEVIPGVKRITIRSDSQFNKSRLLNQAAEAAGGEILAIHDADLVPSIDYLRRCVDVCGLVESARPGRLIFYLNEQSTKSIINGLAGSAKEGSTSNVATNGFAVDQVVQNTPNPMIVRRKTYFQLGGHDEEFEGWGGEDLEFLSRLRTAGIDECGSLPLIHLWHPPAPKKHSGHRNQSLQDAKLSLPAEERIRMLRGSAESCG